MTFPGSFVIALIAVTLLSLPFVIRILIAATRGREIGARSLAKQPDTIELVEAEASAWNRLADIQALEQPLIARGFASAGVFRIRELPGVVVQLLVDEPHRVLACLYEHPTSGIWTELVVRTSDGGEHIVSSNRPTGLAPRPQVTIEHVRGGGIEAMCVVLERLNEIAPRVPVRVSEARERFERAWAEAIAYRKRVGISTAEVVQVVTRRSA
jgi:hypothetical protein